MTRLLIIRHGNSEANTKGTFAGATDSPLTELGLRQAEATAQYIEQNYSVDVVYASDLSRAFITGKAVAERFGLPVIPTKEMREIFAGEWEGQNFDALIKRKSFQLWKTDIGNAVCDGGESVAQLQSRIVTEVMRIARENPGKTVAIATHATPVRVLQCHCEGKTLDEMKDIPWVSNASVSEFFWDGKQLVIVKVGSDAHLEGIKTALPPNC